MKKTLAAGIVSTLVFAGCSAAPATPDRITAARQALLYAGQLMRHGKVSPEAFRPSALLGVQVALFLGKTAEAGVASALKGVEIQQALLMEGREHVSEAFAVLTALSDALEVDITDMLNRTSERQEALDAYVTALTNYLDAAKTQAEALAQQQREAETDARAKRTAASDIARVLSRARSNKDYSTVSQKQEELIKAQADQAAADAKVREVRTTLNVLNELIDVSAERLRAIAENREILIAGLKVVEVPGIEDLGIIIERNDRRGGGGNIFGEPL